MSKDSKKSTSQIKKALKEWGIILGIFGILYFTGLHTEVIGGLQRILLSTGILRPDTEIDASDIKKANFDMPLISLTGDQTSLKESEGKTIFLNFWATWCPPCIAEMPNIQGLYEDISENENIVFVMLSLDEDHEKARAFMKRKEFTMPVYFLRGRQPGVYNSSVVPTTYIISPEGDIVMEKRGMAKYNTSGFKEFLLSL
ncbi:MAG: TlpA disulfide reductase family protein [Balneolaceae bacterium]